MKRAAVTGITGQDGTYLARWLMSQGYEVHGLLRLPFDREETRLLRRFGPERVTRIRWYTGSLEDPFSLVRFLKVAQPDEIYHLAGITDSRQSFVMPRQTVSTIVLGTLHLLEAAREIHATARIFLASSCEIFGVPVQVPQDENTPKQPVTPYGIAKLAADQFARLHRERYGQFVSTGILYNHESPLRPQNYLSRRVVRAVAAIQQGRVNEFSLTDLGAERDWSDARDFVRGFWLTLQAKTPSDYVFASGRSYRVDELVECAFQAAGLNHRKFVKVAKQSSTTRQVLNGLCGNARKAKAELQWTCEWDFRTTIQDMVRAELDARPEIERADPSPQRIGNA